MTERSGGWGENNNGEIAIPTNVQSVVAYPSEVVGPGRSGTLSGVTAIAATHDASLALKSDGTLWSWGNNGTGELGNGTTVNQSSPVQVTGPGGTGTLSGVRTLAAGGYHALALKNDGTVWSWGYDVFGQLGYATTGTCGNSPFSSGTCTTSPAQVTSLSGIGIVGAGLYDSLAAAAPAGGGTRQASTTYTYDNLYRLTGAVGPTGTTSYSYDPTGNRLSKVLGGTTTTSTYDKADRILSAGTTSYTVNAAGNETARGSDTFAYDQANRLISATVGGGTSTYTYDGDGKRTSKTVGGVTTSYVYDVAGGLPVLLDDGARKYVWGAGGLASTIDKATAALQVYHTDGLGSVRAITDTTGSVTQTYQTDEFGVPTQTQGDSSQPFSYTGEQRDSEDGLTYLRARMYDATSGRFLQADPLRKSGSNSQGWNRYTYVQNSPANFGDPSGLFASKVLDSAGCFSRDLLDPSVYLFNPACLPAQYTLSDEPSPVLGPDFERLGPGSGIVQNSSRPVFNPPSTGTTLQNNKANGDAFRDFLVELFRRAIAEAGSEIEIVIEKTVETPLGFRRLDLAFYRGVTFIGGIEAKFGASRYLTTQRAKDAWIYLDTGYQVTVQRATDFLKWAEA